MKRIIKVWAGRITLLILLLIACLVTLVLNPSLLYARKTFLGPFTIYHNQPLDSSLSKRIDEAYQLVEQSELFDKEFKFDLCLNDGSSYPSIIKMVQGEAFAWGFNRQVVLGGKADFMNNFCEIRGYCWNLVQLLAHEQIHCLQANRFGLMKSLPWVGHKDWVWEGYPEYVARKPLNKARLVDAIRQLADAEKKRKDGWIMFNTSEGSLISYYRYYLLVRYCIEIKKVRYFALLQSPPDEQALFKEMIEWSQSKGI